jgi:hypothetical protein
MRILLIILVFVLIGCVASSKSKCKRTIINTVTQEVEEVWEGECREEEPESERVRE